MNKIKDFNNGCSLIYDSGKFDDWCIFYMLQNGKKIPPHDTEYFDGLLNLGKIFGVNKVYEDFKIIFLLTEKSIKKEALKKIEELSLTYGEYRFNAEGIFTILYAAMVAEENKENSILGKRIKMLGVHSLLIENKGVDYSANFMRGMSWTVLDNMCKERGF